MNSKKKKKIKKIKELIAVISVLALFGIIVLIITIMQFSKAEVEPKVEEKTVKVADNEIMSKNVADVEYSRERTDRYLEFSGLGEIYEKSHRDLNTTNIMNYIEKTVCEVLPDFFEKVKNYDDSELEKYFDANKNSINEKFGITDKNVFINFINTLKNKNIDISTWADAIIVKGSFIAESDKENYSYFEFKVGYEKSNQITYGLYVLKDTSVSIDKILVIK